MMIKDRTRPRVVRSWTLLGLIILVTAVLAAAGTWAVTYGFAAPDSTSERPSRVTYPIQPSSFADTRSVSLRFAPNPEQTLHVPAAGTVTSVNCEVGSNFTSGSAPISLDSIPRIVLSTSSPFYRDLNGGETGDDVSSLQSELTTLGWPTPVSGTFDRHTRTSVSALLLRNGVSPGSGSRRGEFSLSEFMWMSSAATQIKECDAVLGEIVSSGDDFAKMDGGEHEIDYTPPGDLLVGDRVLTIDGYTTPAPPNGRITDPATIRSIDSLPTVAAFVSMSALPQGAESMPAPQAQLSLKAAIPVYGVPPATIVSATGDGGCVAEGRQTFRVTILSSSLGLTYVRFDDGVTPPHSVLLHPARNLRCRS
jgi:hypothetical protein